MVFVKPGSPQPMEMDMNNAKAHHGDMEKEVEKWHSVGTETITVPAGTFSCEYSPVKFDPQMMRQQLGKPKP
jgi:hypothetical protein